MNSFTLTDTNDCWSSKLNRSQPTSFQYIFSVQLFLFCRTIRKQKLFGYRVEKNPFQSVRLFDQIRTQFGWGLLTIFFCFLFFCFRLLCNHLLWRDTIKFFFRFVSNCKNDVYLISNVAFYDTWMTQAVQLCEVPFFSRPLQLNGKSPGCNFLRRFLFFSCQFTKM